MAFQNAGLLEAISSIPRALLSIGVITHVQKSKSSLSVALWLSLSCCFMRSRSIAEWLVHRTYPQDIHLAMKGIANTLTVLGVAV